MTVERSIPDAVLDDDDINLHIGRRLRRRRRIMGLTQKDLGEAVQVKFQQIQKYECAANRIAAARLFALAVALRVPVQYFFDGLPVEGGEPPARTGADSSEARDILEAYYGMSPLARKRLIAFMKSLAETASV